MTNQIHLHTENGAWQATYVGPHAKNIRSLFGAATLPTAFTTAAKLDNVIATVRNRNPGVEVMLKPF